MSSKSIILRLLGLKIERRDRHVGSLAEVTDGGGRLDGGLHTPHLPPVIVPCAACSSPNRLPAARLQQKARCAECKTTLLPLTHSVPVTTTEQFDELVSDSPVPVLVDFWAAWCGPCRTVGPEIEKVARGTPGSLVVAKVDTEALPQIASRFGIRSIPTMILFRGGAEAKRVSGAMPAQALRAELGV